MLMKKISCAGLLRMPSVGDIPVEVTARSSSGSNWFRVGGTMYVEADDAEQLAKIESIAAMFYCQKSTHNCPNHVYVVRLNDSGTWIKPANAFSELVEVNVTLTRFKDPDAPRIARPKVVRLTEPV